MDGLSKTTLFLLLLGSVFSKETPASPKYFTKHTDSCPDVGYFFHREVLPNRTDGCHLCVCQQNNTATCWPRESKRCDVNLPQGRIARVRRSPIGLSDIFFRDATRDFFHKQLPEQCKPHESSFSDGCPPADWCIGCTVCDCDAHGRWDCHILSFCNGEEKKRRVKRPKPVMPTRRVYHNGKPKPKPNSTTLRPKRIAKKSIPKPQVNKNPSSVSRKNIKSQENGKSKSPKKINTARRPQPKRIYKKNVTTRTTTRKPKKRYIKKRLVKPTTNKPKENIETEVTKIMNAKSDDEKSVLGKRIVKRVMSTVQKMIRKEISKLNDTKRVQRSVGNKGCSKGKKRSHHNTKKEKQKKTKTRNRQINRNLTRRRKREALDIDLSMIDLKDDSDAGTVLPNKSLNVTFLPETTAKIMATTESPREFNTTLDFVKYKYSLEKYSSNASSTTELTPEETEMTKSNLVVNHAETKSSVNTIDVVKTKGYTLISADPNFNDLKHKKWEHMKILRNHIKTNEVLKFDRNGNKSNFHDNELKNKTRRKDIERTVAVTTKNNLKQIIRIQNKSTSTEKNANDAVKYAVDNGNVSSFQSILHILINNSYSTSPSKVKQEFNLFKYLRSMFKKIFNRKKNLTLKQNQRSKELQTLEILCENIGACFMNKHNRVALRSKLHDLNVETDNIFKFLKTIKGLLRLIEIPYKSIRKHNENSLDDDIQKLNTILKGTYAEQSLTETQTAQIRYLKENVHEFVRSLSRFASILNEIFNVLYKNNKKYGCQRKLRPSQKKKKQNTFIKIKNLLVKYNIVQNTFMKNMYKLLTEMEKNKTTEKPKQKVSAIEMNNTQIIDTYSMSIVENLMRLKNLAQTLNSNRSKRQLPRENHETEYLLMLMEYLLKHNQPSDPPVNDGIDLLVEAIENAPDVKFVTKKVRNYDSTYETTTNDINMDFGGMDSEDSISDNKISKEELKSKNDNNFTIEQRDKEDESTQIVYYHKIDDYDNNTQTNKEYDTTENLIKRTIHKAEKTGFDKFESAIDDTRRYEVFSSDLEDDEISFITSTNKNEPTTATVTEESNTFIALQHYRLDDEDTTNSTNDKKRTLDWIEENFSREIRDHIAENSSDSATPPILDPVTVSPVTESPVTVSTSIPTVESLDNTSGMSVELEGEKMKKPSADEFLRQKQMQFLSYLDYGTESTDTESDSKDKYEDGFPSYFVR